MWPLTGNAENSFTLAWHRPHRRHMPGDRYPASSPERCLLSRHRFRCCALEPVYAAIAWQCVDQIRYNMKNVHEYRSQAVGTNY
jgi:hypothetical protein